ncbi:TIR domain-containing protein [Sandaracinobacter neustonicus]|uniref:TIR domain-containing protein n=1 Tax=Sandaracinobacter neustonicus TaxID=1715348 RepID=A0A501XE93_9SPHN|nr:TIR domain-containing protein [Sandaracinobacter neustonicus]TPE58789.1 TIR domain-containing protein [Sandaracinobacter neustonicus]
MDAAKGIGEGRVPEADFLFVSYSHADAKAAATVVQTLQSAGFTVWWDALIPGGDRFGATTNDALERAKAVVVLWSKASVGSHWVHDEATFARDKRRLVPLSIDGSEPPLGFRQFQYIDVSKDGMKPGSPAMQRAIESLGLLMERGAPDAAPAAAPRFNRRALIGAGAVVLAAAAGFGAWKLARPGAAASNSIAVLPFDNLGSDGGQGYFSDGLAAELRSQLSRNPLLKVMGQTSSNEFRGDKDDARAIAGKLGVNWLLDGNVRISDGVVRVAIELIDGETGFTKWSDSFDRPLANIFQVQQEIAQAVDRILAVEMGAGDETKLARSGTTGSVAAFDAFLRGRDMFESQRDEASDRGALARFEEAIRLDPDYAGARAARARTLAVIANQYAQADERQRLYGQAVEEARTAIRIAPELADGHVALGYALFYGQLNAKAAEEHYARAAQFGQGSPDVLSRYALYRARRRQFDDADAAIDRAATLDPLNPSVFKAQGLIRYARGDWEGAIESASHALEINPQRSSLHGDIGNALVQLNRLDEAEAAFAKEKNGLLALPGRAIVAARRGDMAASNAALAQLLRDHGDNGFYQQAQVLAQQGRKADALDALEKAHAAGDSGLVTLDVDPYLAPLRGDPRFGKLLATIGFT